MKKIVLLALAAAAICGTSSANAQEVVLVEDCAQGVLLNRNVDNWFLTAQGGANFLVGHHDIHAGKKNRIGANAALYVGKWVTPTFGFRFGANWAIAKGATTANGLYRKMNEPALANGYYPEKFMAVGPEFDVLVNLTNWWCGYHPGRWFNVVAHGGFGAYWTMYRGYGKGAATPENLHWRNAKNTMLFANLGFQFNFRVAKHLDLFLDPQAELIDFSDANGLFSVNAGLTYHFGKTEWNCPIIAVCAEHKYSDADYEALQARFDNAQRTIKQLQEQVKQLQDALRNQKPVVQDCEGLVTVYYPINKADLSARDKIVLKSVAEVMKESGKKYKLTGWADNYTGTEEINTRLRNARVDGVKNYLVSCGVDANQLDATIDSNNLTDFGAKGAPLDRAVTIRLAE